MEALCQRDGASLHLRLLLYHLQHTLVKVIVQYLVLFEGSEELAVGTQALWQLLLALLEERLQNLLLFQGRLGLEIAIH